MKKKKLLALGMVAALSTTAVVGGTLAYFTDTDAAKNVMVTGKLDIVQNEHQRVIEENADGTVTYLDGKLEEFEDGKKLVPKTGTTLEYESDAVKKGLVSYMFDNDENYVDKIVSVTSAQGSEDAYIRTLFAFEMVKDENGKWYDPIENKNQGIWLYWMNGLNGKGFIYPESTADGINCSEAYDNKVDYTYVEIDGVTYSVAEYYYKTNSNQDAAASGVFDSSIRAGQQTHASLVQVAMCPTVTNEQAKMLVGEDGEFTILALTQATQKAGFTDAKTALDTAFGDVSKVNAETLQKWFAECK